MGDVLKFKSCTALEGGWCQDAYDRWAESERQVEEGQRLSYRKMVIEQGDPECEEVISALEDCWVRGNHERG